MAYLSNIGSVFYKRRKASPVNSRYLVIHMTTQIRKTHKNHSHSSKTYRAPDALSKAIVKLVDKASEALKDGIVKGARKGRKEHKLLKKHAFRLVTKATHQLIEAVEEGSAIVRKGLKRI